LPKYFVVYLSYRNIDEVKKLWQDDIQDKSYVSFYLK